MTGPKIKREKTPVDAEVQSAADRWVMKLADGVLQPDEARAFNAWLTTHPSHEIAFDAAQDAYERAAVLRNDPRLDDWLRPSVYERLAAFVARASDVASGLARPRRALPALGAAGLAIAAAVAIVIAVRPEPVAAPGAIEPDIVTAAAEIRETVLPDGSVVTLGAASSIDIQFSENERRVVLGAGEAFFEVERDEDRPFIVLADETLVRVIGTKFDVSLGLSAVDVAVSEGRVEVIRPKAATAPIKDADVQHVLTAGQRVSAIKSGRVQPVVAVDVSEVAAWRRGELVWENAPVGDIIADLDRYADHRIALEQDDVSALRYTFAFQAENIDQAVDIIADTLGLELVTRANGDVVLR